MVITFDNVSFNYNSKDVLDKASFSITDKDKIGIVGVNGAGKTTILKLIMGIEKPNSGTIIKSGGMIISYLSQEPMFDENKSILDIVLENSTKDHKIEEYEAKSILSKMGLKDYNITPKNFSGGELKRLALAKSLLEYSDILILDEPTNHLDIKLIVWLEKYLIKRKNGIILVTHDRYFLERICNKMLEVDYAKTYTYDANYELFLELKAERIKLEEARERKLKLLFKKEKEWINRSPEARSTKQKARIERYNELKDIKFNEKESMSFSSITTRLGKKLIVIENGKKEFGDNLLFDNFNFSLNRTDIIGLVGDNGVGKSTLFKILYGIEELSSGNLIKGETLKIGYLKQNIDKLNLEERVIDYIKEYGNYIDTIDGRLSASELLDNFLFDDDKKYGEIKLLSGGEKRRLELLRVLITNPNMLLLDEPTNDLDIYTLELLEDFLLNFVGPIIVISHDRYFLDKICNKLLIIDDKTITESNLMYSDYLELEGKKEKEETPKEKIITKTTNKHNNEIRRIEKEINEIDEEIKIIKSDLALETTNYIKITELQEKVSKLENREEELLDKYYRLIGDNN